MIVSLGRLPQPHGNFVVKNIDKLLVLRTMHRTTTTPQNYHPRPRPMVSPRRRRMVRDNRDILVRLMIVISRVLMTISAVAKLHEEE